MTARIIPFMLRRTDVEFRRRRNWLLQAWWDAYLTPVRLWLGLWR